MADDNQLIVEIIAKLDQLSSGLNSAVGEIKDAVGQINNSINETHQTAQNFGSRLETALNLGVFLELEAVAVQAMAAVREAFDSTIGKAEEFGLSNAKFAKIIGTSVQEATGLSEALQGVGISTEQYESFALRLTARIGTQEQKLRELGVTTRDTSGQLLGGKAAMDAISAAMNDSANAAHAADIATAAFGARGAKAAYDMIRVTGPEVAKLNELMRELGVQTGDTSATSAKLEEQLNELRVMWDAVWIAIGQHLMPVVEDFTKWATGPGIGAFQALGTIISFVADTVVALGTVFLVAGNVIGGVILVIIDEVKGAAAIIEDFATGHFGKVISDVGDTWNRIYNDIHKTITQITSEVEGAQKLIDGLGNKKPVAPDDKGAYGAKGGENAGQAGQEKPNKGAAKLAEQLADEKIQAEERMSLAVIAIEEDRNHFLLQMGQETVDQFIAQATDLENKKYAVELDGLQKKAQADAGDKLREQKDQDAILLLAKQHQLALQKIDEEAANQKKQLADQERADFIKNKEEELTDAINAYDEDYRQDKITMQQKTDLEKQLTTAVYTEILARKDAEIASLHEGTKEWAKAMQERAEIYRQMVNKIKKLDDDMTNYDLQKWKTTLNSIYSAFNSNINAMILGQKSWQAAVGDILNSVADAFLQMGEKWLEEQITNFIFGETEAKASAVTQIAANAAIAGAAGTASMAAAPWPIDMTAPEFGAAMYADAMSYSAFAVAEKGMVLDKDQVVSAHKEEMILPANISRGLQNIIARSGGNFGHAELTFAPTINAPQSKSLSRMLVEESAAMRSWFQTEIRNGGLNVRGSR